MVYCGKPSRGCQMCRTRRIKCDETKPTCVQCQKSRRQCPGYKDDFDLVFRNETKATERRVRKSIGPGRRTAPSTFQKVQITFARAPQGYVDVHGASSLISPSDSVSSLALIKRTLIVPVEEQASCFFVKHFVHTPQEPHSRGWLDFVEPLIKNETSESHLSVAFSAVAMASLANRPSARGRGLMPKAFALYTNALMQLNAALRIPAQQKEDSTVASILLLGLFETITSEKSSVLAWGSHIDGAVQLIRMRGKKQLRSKTGLALFLAVRTQMLVMVMSASKSPVLGVDWWVIESPSDHGVFVISLLLRVAELRAEINHCLGSYPRTPEYFQKVLDLMRRAQYMESEFQDWKDSVPESWRVKTAAWMDNVPGGDLTKADIYPGKVDMYRDIFIAAMWNQSRISRLFLAGLIIRCAAWVCSPVDYRTTPEYASSARVGVDTVADIIASVPYHFGWRVSDNGQLKPGDLSGSTSGNDNITSAKAIGGYHLTWPLTCALYSDYTTDSQRQWIKGRMHMISDVFGINQAKTVGSFQVRLPSMTIFRDNTQAAYPSLARIPQKTRTTSDVKDRLNAHLHIPVVAELATTATDTKRIHPPSAQPNYATHHVQHPMDLQRVAFEKERKLLLSKASNSGGEHAERAIGDYLDI